MTPPFVMVSEPALEGDRAFLDIHPLRIAALSIHSSPLGKLGTGDTGGMSVYTRELFGELGRAGHNIDIYTCADSGRSDPELFLSENVRLIHLNIGCNGHVTKGVLFGHLPEVFESLEAYVESNHACYDLIHSHYWLSGEVGSLARNRWYMPHVVMYHTTGIAKRVACGHEREPAHRLIAEKKLAHRSDRVLAATEGERDLLMRYYGVPQQKIGIVPCGVNLERFRPVARELARKELRLQDARFVVLYVGRFAPVKGLERLISAAAHLRSQRDLTFVIIGGDGLKSNASAELNRLVRRASIGGIVSFQGRVDHDLLPLYYSAADVLVVPSYYESFGLVALESLACGTPVIATRVGVMETLIQEGETGLLVDTPSPRSLASAIERFILASPNSGISCEKIRASVLNYGWPNVASAITQEYMIALQPSAAWQLSGRIADRCDGNFS
jgi:D-inositol-3-phosphate glycosyltransferase